MNTDRVAFATNAKFGEGGQGEFLRLMASALSGRSGATIYSRFLPAGHAHHVNLPFTGTIRSAAFDAILGTPLLRRRQDWLTLLSDVDFDERVAAVIDPPALFDGVMAQCASTIAALKRAQTRIILTSLNTHIGHLDRVMRAEYQRVGAPGPSFIHPRMVSRALREIAAADHIRVNSTLAKTTFVDAGIDPSRITAIHPGIDLDHFTPVAKRDDVFRVLTVGSIDPRKGVHHLLEAFDTARLPNAELLIIGGTGDRWSRDLLQSYRSRLPNVVCRAVDVMTVPVAETFGTASVVVHAALEDGFGLVVPQALASGRPVIVTRSTGASELVTHGRNGFLVNPGAPSEIAGHLRALAHDHAMWSAMCDASRPSVSHLTYAAFAVATNALYETVLHQ